MSDFIVEVIEPNNNNIELNANVTNLEIINTEKLLASDFPDFYHTKIIDFDDAVRALIGDTGGSVSIEDVQDIIGLSGIVGGTGIKVVYNDTTGYTFIHTSGLTLGTSVLRLGSTYQSLLGLSMISGISISSPTIKSTKSILPISCPSSMNSTPTYCSCPIINAGIIWSMSIPIHSSPRNSPSLLSLRSWPP